MKKIILMSVLLVFGLINKPCLYADMTGSGDMAIVAKLSAIYKAIKDQYEGTVALLRETKIQSENLKTIQATAKAVKGEMDFLKNLDLERELKAIEGDIQGLTLLDDIDGKNTDRQFDMMMRELDRRFEGQTSEASRDTKRKIASKLNSLKRFSELQKTKNKEAAEFASGSMSEKEAITSIASSNALLAALELAKEQRRIEQAMENTDELHERKKVHKAYTEAIDRMSQK